MTMVMQCNGADGGSPNGQTSRGGAGGNSFLGRAIFDTGSAAPTSGGGGYGAGGAGLWTPGAANYNGKPGIVIIERIAG